MTALTSDALPTSLDLADFAGAEDSAQFDVTCGGFGLVLADFTSLTISPVPLPASLPLLIGGLGVLALARRKRASSGR